MPKGIHHRTLLTATAWLALFGSTALLAQQAADEAAFNPGAAIEDIEAMQLQFNDPDADELTVSNALELVGQIRAGAESCVADTRPEVARLDGELGILPVFNENENIEIWERRNALQAEKSLVEARLIRMPLQRPAIPWPGSFDWPDRPGPGRCRKRSMREAHPEGTVLKV